MGQGARPAKTGRAPMRELSLRVTVCGGWRFPTWGATFFGRSCSMTGSPFSNVVGTDQDSSTFKRVESTQTTDTTSETAARPADSDSEPSLGVQVQAGGVTHEAGQDEAAGGGSSGTPTFST